MQTPTMFRFFALLAALWSLALSPARAETVRLQDAWTTLEFPKGAEARVDPILTRGAELRDYGAEILGVPPRPVPLDVRVVPSPEDMMKAAPDGAPPPDYAAGVAYPELRLIIIAMRAPYTHEAVDVAQTYRHEYMHAALRDATDGQRLPRWFHEGVAIFASGERLSERRETLLRAIAVGGVIPLEELDRHFADGSPDAGLAYAQAADVIRLLTKPSDRPRFHRLLARIREGQSFNAALGDAYSTDLRRLQVEWQKELASAKGEALGSLIATGSGLWFLGAALLGYAWWQKRSRGQVTLQRWQAEDAREAEERARVEAWFAAHREQDVDVPHSESGDDALPFAQLADEEHGDRPRDPNLPYVERDGQWHVLH